MSASSPIADSDGASPLTQGHEAFSRYYLPRLRRWGRGATGSGESVDMDDRITSLVLDGRDMTDRDCEQLAAALEANASLTYLSMSANPAVTVKGVIRLAQAIASHPALQIWRIAGPSTVDGTLADTLSAASLIEAESEEAANRTSGQTVQVGGELVRDASVTWVPAAWQGATAPLEQRDMQRQLAEVRASPSTITSGYRAIAIAVVRSSTLRRVFLPSPPPTTLLCPITGNVFDPADASTQYGSPAALAENIETTALLRGASRFADVALRVAHLNAVRGTGAWKRCLLTALASTPSEFAVLTESAEDVARLETMHDLSAGAAERPVPLLSAVRLLGDALTPCRSIRRLDFSGHGASFGDKSLALLSGALQARPCELQELRIASCDVTCAGVVAMLQALGSNGGNKSLTEVDLGNNRVADRSAQAMLDVVRKGTTALSYVNLDGNCITPKLQSTVLQNLALNAQPVPFKESLLQLEADNATVTRCVFNTQASGMRLSDMSCRLLLHALRPNTRIVHIDVSNNTIGDEGAGYLAEIIAGNRTLRRLIAQRNRITDEGAALMVAAVPRNPSLELVDLQQQDPPLRTETLDRLRWLGSLNSHPFEIKSKGLLILQNDASLTSVSIGGYDGQRRLTEASVAVLCEMLAVNHTVRSLTIRNHPPAEHIRMDQTLPMIAAIAHKLSELDLSANGLTDAGSLHVLLQMLRSPTQGAESLVTLRLRDNDFSSNAAADFAATLRTKNSKLTELDLTGNPRLSADDLSAVQYAASLNRYDPAFKALVGNVELNSPQVKEISLVQVERMTPWGTSHHFAKRYDDLAAELLALALDGNTTVTSINLSGHNIGDSGAVALAAMLRTNGSITALHLNGNNVGNEGLAALTKALIENHAVRILTLDANRRITDHATQKQLQLCLVQNVESSKNATGGTNTAAVYNASLIGKKAKLHRAAEQNRIVDAAIFDDAMADFHASQQRQAAAKQRQAEAERAAQTEKLQKAHENKLAATPNDGDAK
jgi:Ran GTPase-activating protein (RanGAP) involved in mRNA processing and transport